jgi:hypothetical protein
VAIETLERLAERQRRVLDALAAELDESYREREGEYVAFQLQMLRSLRLRAQSTHERLGEEINLAYNMLASSDNMIMKSITLLTMIFFPATFIAVGGPRELLEGVYVLISMLTWRTRIVRVCLSDPVQHQLLCV